MVIQQRESDDDLRDKQQRPHQQRPAVANDVLLDDMPDQFHGTDQSLGSLARGWVNLLPGVKRTFTSTAPSSQSSPGVGGVITSLRRPTMIESTFVVPISPTIG